MKLRPVFSRTRRRIQTLRSLSEAVQRRLGLDSHAAVVGFAARLAVSRVRNAAAQSGCGLARADRDQSWLLKHYGDPGTGLRHAVFLDVTGDRAELARAQLFRLALAAAPSADTALGLIVHDSALQAQVAAEAADWVDVIGRPLIVAYADRPALLSAEEGSRLRVQMKLARVHVLDATWVHERFEDVLQTNCSVEKKDGRSADRVVCGVHVTDSGVVSLHAPENSLRCAAQLPPWSSAANRFGALVPWIVRGTRLLDRAGRLLGAIGGGAAVSEAIVDLCLRLPDGSLFVGGWWTSVRDSVIGMSVVDVASGIEIDVREAWSAIPRPELRMAFQGLIEDFPAEGFVAYLPVQLGVGRLKPARFSRAEPTDAGGKQRRSLLQSAHVGSASLEPTYDRPATDDVSRAMILRARFASGHTQDLTLNPQTCPDRLEAASQLLSRLPQAHPDLRGLLDRHFGPAVSALGGVPVVVDDDIVVHSYGPAPEAPSVSVVVSLYGRHDFLRHQLAHFCGDAQLRRADLIYVIDDPRLVAIVEAEATDLALLFGVSFRTVHARRNLGYAGANNLGARFARAPMLLLLNSDVMPSRSGWLDAMCSALNTPGAGAVGARLLFEDGSVQHAGMSSAPYGPWDGLPINLHPGKALPDIPRSGCEPVHAVTGACLMLRTDLYRKIGGLDEGFLVGDFEDSELCARLRRRGLLILLCHDTVLVHLERQSMPSGDAAPIQARRSLYNAWRAARVESLEAVA